MRAELAIAMGRGHAGAQLLFTRSDPPARKRRWVTVAAALLTLPFALTLALVILSQYTNVPSAGAVNAVLGGRGDDLPARLVTLGPPLALLLLAAARVRIQMGSHDGRWTGRASAVLSRGDVIVGLLAIGIVAVFFGHLAADTWACMHGNTGAC